MVRRWLAATAYAGLILTAGQPANAYPFKMDSNSITNWLNTLRFSTDPTFQKRFHGLHDCENSREYLSDEEKDQGLVGYIRCAGYIDIWDGKYPNGTTCNVSVTMYYDSSTAIRKKVKVYFAGEEGKYCYKGWSVRKDKYDASTLLWQ